MQLLDVDGEAVPGRILLPRQGQVFSWVDIYIYQSEDIERDYDPNNLHHDHPLLSFHSPHSLDWLTRIRYAIHDSLYLTLARFCFPGWNLQPKITNSRRGVLRGLHI